MARAITCWLKQVWSPKVRHSQSYCSNAQACSETLHSFLNHKLQDSVLVEKESALPQFSADELKKKLFEVKAQRESLKEKKRQEVKDRLRREREEYLAKQPKTQEDVLLQRIELVTHKIESRQRLLKKYEVPDIHKEYKETEDLSPELRHYYKKMGQKYKNYVPVGRRGIYGGTIQNLHMHWKKHETCRVDCHMFSMDQARHMAEELSKLTGGVVIDILHDKTIILFRGINYQRPDQLIPENMLDKRKALKKSLLQQSVNSLQGHLSTLQEELRQRTLLKQTGSTGLVPLIIPKKKMTIEHNLQEDDIPEVEEYNYWVKKAFF